KERQELPVVSRGAGHGRERARDDMQPLDLGTHRPRHVHQRVQVRGRKHPGELEEDLLPPAKAREPVVHQRDAHPRRLAQGTAQGGPHDFTTEATSFALLPSIETLNFTLAPGCFCFSAAVCLFTISASLARSGAALLSPTRLRAAVKASNSLSIAPGRSCGGGAFSGFGVSSETPRSRSWRRARDTGPLCGPFSICR